MSVAHLRQPETNADEVAAPETHPGPSYLPDEGQMTRVWIGILVGIPVATTVGLMVAYVALAGTGAESHALVLSLPFGGLFGFLGGGIGGLMATIKH
jgi:hypothetical protein